MEIMPFPLRLSLVATVLISAACSGSTAQDGDTLGVVRPPGLLFREYLVLEGTTLQVRLDNGVGSATGAVDDTVEGTLTEALVVNGTTVAPVGSLVQGQLTAVEPSPVDGRASLAFQFRTLVVSGHRDTYAIATGISRVAPTDQQADVITITDQASGADAGDPVSGNPGAIMGAVVEGSLGAAIELTATGRNITLPPGTRLTMALKAPIKIRIPLVAR